MLPLTLLVQWRPGSRESFGFQPYVGAGTNSTITWEKSGALDAIDVPTHVGPEVQLGFDQSISATSWLNVDARWGTLRVDLSEMDPNARELKVDPLVFALGMAFAF